MRVIVVNVAELLNCPPALSVIKALDDLGHEVIVCAIGFDKSNYFNNLGNTNNVKFEYIYNSYKDNIPLPQKLGRMFSIRKKLWKIIDKYYDSNSILWVVSEVSIKHLGKKLLGKKYLLHMLELIEEMNYISGSSLFKLDRCAYVSHASRVVEAEYNRAHITKAWWNLKELPSVLPNKPYVTMNIPKNAPISSSDDIANLIDKLSEKKIVLYQGNISAERPLDVYIKAVGELGDKWAFVMMINGDNPYPDLHINNLFFVPFIAPPFHLEVTSHAYIGILSYVPVKNSHSILNTLYCAPNKIWEYSKFGIPMVGNDLPALNYLFGTEKVGVCIENMSVEDVKKAILKIDNDYENYSKSSKHFFDSFDIRAKVAEIIETAMQK